MKDTCDKCKKDASNGSWHTQGNIYRFCKSCSETVSMLPTNSMHLFLGKSIHNQENRNILRAKKMREEGIRQWSKV